MAGALTGVALVLTCEDASHEQVIHGAITGATLSTAVNLLAGVLLTSSDAILANLTPALVAEANMLCERFAHQYHRRTLLGMYPRNRRGESSRRVMLLDQALIDLQEASPRAELQEVVSQ